MSQIIARTDSNNRPVIFMLDKLNFAARTIDAYYPQTDTVEHSTLDYYKTTKSVPDAQEAELAQAFVNKFGLGSDFAIRRKMFRVSKMINLNGADVKQEISKEEQKLLPSEEFINKLVEAMSKALREALTT